MRIFRLFYTNFVSKRENLFAGFPLFCIFILFFHWFYP